MVFNIHLFWWRFVIQIPCGQLTLHLFLFKHDRSILTGCYCLLQNVNPMNIIYRLSLTFGLLVLPEYTPFSHAALVEATREDHSKYGCLRHQWPGRWICVDFKLTSDLYFCTAMNTMNGFCDEKNFYITIGHRGQDINFHVTVGKRELSADLYTEYGVKKNSCHMNMTVPFLAQDVVFEVQPAFTSSLML